jgi:hypothetical protein
VNQVQVGSQQYPSGLGFLPSSLSPLHAQTMCFKQQPHQCTHLVMSQLGGLTHVKEYDPHEKGSGEEHSDCHTGIWMPVQELGTSCPGTGVVAAAARMASMEVDDSNWVTVMAPEIRSVRA